MLQTIIKLLILINIALIATTTGQSSFTTVCNNTVLSSGDTGGICYNISDVTATWHVANAICVSNGGRLAKISNWESRDEIIRIIDNRNGTEDYWIGLKRVGDTSQYEWTDGTDYNEWSSNIPMQGYDCVGVKGNSSNLVSLDCNNSNYYICETDVCSGWRVRNGICYKRFDFTEDNKVDWYDAIDHCNEENAYLAEIPNIYVDNIINDMLVGAGDEHCWIGFSTDDEGNYNWRIGNFPLGPKSSNNDMCGVIGLHKKGDEREWELKSCNSSKTKYKCAFCMKGPLTIEVPKETCSGLTPNVIIDGGSCYRRIEGIPRELHIAYLTCNSYNGSLYTFNDRRVNKRLYSSDIDPTYVYRSFWLQNPNQYSLADSQDGYFNLVDREVTYSDKAQCQILTGNGNTNGDANSGSEANDDCEDINDCNKCDVNYICKIDYVPNPRFLNGISINNTRYWSVSGNRNWAEAETECVTEGGHLVEIFNEATQLIIVSLIATEVEYLDELYWIGIGDYVCYNNFSLNPATISDSTCVAIDKNGKWIISNCENKYSFVCGKNAIVGDNSPCPNPTTNATILPTNATTGYSSFTTVCNNTVLSSGDTGGICYNISDVTATWHVANATCVSNGGRLAKIFNSRSRDEIQRIIDNRNGTEDYWIGLKRVGDTSQYEWTDGTNVTYNEWSINIPMQGYDCVGVKRWDWSLINCTDSHFYICETDVCNGWRVRNGTCYKKFVGNTTWNKAVRLCEAQNAYLAEIPNMFSNDIINYLIKQDECWIGLSTNDSDYSWRIGNFSLSDPTKAVALNESDTNKCGTIGMNYGQRWGLEDCNVNQTCAVCMKGPLTSEYPINYCTNLDKAIVDRGICYRKNVKRATELDLAILTCNRINGELYTFDDNATNYRLMNIFYSIYNVYPKEFNEQSNLFTPQHGYFNLLTSNENLTTPVNCQALTNDLLEDEPQCKNVNFICKIEYEPDQVTLKRTLSNDTCYWSVSGNRNWTEAETECVTEGGHLVEIFNEATQRIIVSLIATEEEYLDELYWIGIGDYVNSSSQWSSGASICYDNFSEVNDPPQSRCVAINKNGIWFAIECSNKYSYICEKGNATEGMSPCTSNSTAMPSGETGQLYFTTVCNNTVLSSGFTGGICYNISDVTATWHVANATCVSNGGRLAKIFNWESRREIQRITNNRNGREDYWIGLKRVGDTSQYEWTDGTNVTYNESSINNPMQGYDCVGVKRWDWSSINCTDSHFYICETDVCNGWRVINGTCYKKFVGNTNWNKAVGICEAQNAYLAEIPNIHSSDIINYLIQPDECWIGLSTNDSDYSWRIGNFSLSDPTKAVALNESDTNKCGTIGMGNGQRWGLEDCNVNQTCAVCMKGPLKSEYPIYNCRNVDELTIVDRGICYRKNLKQVNELDLAILTCKRFNGELYTFDDYATNYRLISKLDSLPTYSTKVYPKEFNEQSNLFTPQHGYFNLLTSNENLTTPVECQKLTNDLLEDEPECTKVNFICKIEYEPYQVTLLKNVSNDTYYWSVTGNRNWADAETECVTEGGHLVEIFNEATQRIIVSLIATEVEYLDELYWIGIGDYVNSSSQWSSEASICYNNFYLNPATNSDLGCVAIDKNGKWTISNCENKFSFVCGKNATVGDYSPCPNPTINAIPIHNITRPTNATILPTNATNTQNEVTINCDENREENLNCNRIKELSRNRTKGSNIKQTEDFTQNLLDIVNVTTGIILEYKSDELNADVVVIGYNQRRNSIIKIGVNKLNINTNSFPGDVTIVVASYEKTRKGFILDNSTQEIASNFITIVANGKLSGELTIEFQVNPSAYEGDSLNCTSLNSDGSLNSSGIRTLINNNTVDCITNHITTFAVIVTFSTNPGSTPSPDTEIQAYISVVLCVLSLFALLVTLLLYACIGKKFYKQDINIIQLNYVLSLIFALISFLFLSIAFFTEFKFEPLVCTVVTLLNHYTWLSVFSWNFCQALHIVFVLLSGKLPFKRHYLLMLVIGWGLPLPFVIITFGIGVANNAYFNTVANLCFLNTANGLIWGLLIPIYAIILINLGVLFIVIGISIYVQRKRRNRSYVFRLIVGIGTTIPLLGLPWILGLLPNIAGLTNNPQLSWLSYLFVVLNASQGIIFFVVHVIRNSDVRALCSSTENIEIDIKPDDKVEKKQREEKEGKFRGTEGTFSRREEVAPMYLTESTEKNVVFQNENVYS